MSESLVFYPAKKAGLAIHIALAFLLAGGGGVLLWLAFQQPGGGFLTLYLFAALLLVALLAVIAYRAYALLHASYTIERDGLSLRWGLRREDIPLTELEWIRPVDDLATQIKNPAFSMPGAYLGMVNHPDLGKVEFMASSHRSLVIIESFNHVFALSPEKPEEFMRAFNRTLEMGSISPIEPYSSEPAEFIQNVFQNRFARMALIASLLLTLTLVVLTSLLIPTRQILSMGIDAAGNALEPVNSTRLLILPLLGSLAFVLNVVVGLFFFRHEDQRPVSYAIWAAAIITPLLLIVATLVIVF